VSIAAFKVSEWEMSRQLYARLQPEDVVVADSAYGTYVDLVLVQAAKADAVFRKHHASLRFSSGQKELATISSPGSVPNDVLSRWLQMSFKLPDTVHVREVHLLIRQSGFRPKQIILVTTLLDPKRYPKAKLAQLYHLRWQATEVNFKHLKTTLNMEMIWAKSPQMVRKEI